MNDMSQVIVPKSDQLNSDDLIAGPLTVTITNVAIRGGQEQPVSVNFEGDRGKPWKPCKSMSRVLVTIWGPDASKYIGRSVTLYRDPKVKWGGMEVGGIRISHMSHMDGDKTLALTVTKGKREHAIIKPLTVEKKAPVEDKSAAVAQGIVDRINACMDAETLAAVTGDEKVMAQRAWMRDKRPDLAAKVDDAVSSALASFSDDEIPGDEMPGDAEAA